MAKIPEWSDAVYGAICHIHRFRKSTRRNDAIFPGSLRLLFDLELTGTNTKRTIVSNLGKSIVRNLHITLDGNEVQSISDYNVLAVYRDLWLPKA